MKTPYKNLYAYIALFLIFLMNDSFARTVKIWSSIPFLRGQDLCEYQNTFSQTRMEYMQSMTDLGIKIMREGAFSYEALEMLQEFDNLYDEHKSLTKQGKYLDVTLESTLKSFLDQHYRKNTPKTQQVEFIHLSNFQETVSTISQEFRPGDLYPHRDFDFSIAYGSYSYAPNCRGEVLVTLHLVHPNGQTKSYYNQARPESVMSKIALEIIKDFQTTTFPSTIKIGYKTFTLIGTPNGRIGTIDSPYSAEKNCRLLNGKLPTKDELELIHQVGSYNGGIDLGSDVWALPNGYVYSLEYKRRRPSELNTKNYKYYCLLKN